MNLMNHNLKTGIPYGVITAEAIDSDLWHELCYTHGKDPHYEDELAAHLAQARLLHEAYGSEEDFDEDYESQEFAESYEPNEPVYEGEHEGVKYRTTWLGGAQLLWVFESSVLTKCAACSPCVPGAADLDSVGIYLGYGVPADWLDARFIKDQIEKAGFKVVLGPDSKDYWTPEHGGRLNGPFGDMYEAGQDCYEKNLQQKPDDFFIG